jgi:hypothetical protein
MQRCVEWPVSKNQATFDDSCMCNFIMYPKLHCN